MGDFIINNEAILIRIGEVLNVDNQRSIRNRFADDIGVKRESVDRWMSRKSIPINILYDFSRRHQINFHWLIEGVGDKTPIVMHKELLANILEVTEEFVNKTGVDWDKKTIVRYALLVYESELKSSSTSKESQLKMLELISKI